MTVPESGVSRDWLVRRGSASPAQPERSLATPSSSAPTSRPTRTTGVSVRCLRHQRPCYSREKADALRAIPQAGVDFDAIEGEVAQRTPTAARTLRAHEEAGTSHAFCKI
jgi:hypothetical protein